MNNDEGFTLIEALVALAILVAVGAAAAPVFAGSAERSARALERFRSVVAAESLLARVGLDIPLGPERQEGRTADGLRWEIAAEHHAEEGDAGARPMLGLVKVQVSVFPEGAPPVVLSTLRAIDARPGP